MCKRRWFDSGSFAVRPGKRQQQQRTSRSVIPVAHQPRSYKNLLQVQMTGLFSFSYLTVENTVYSKDKCVKNRFSIVLVKSHDSSVSPVGITLKKQYLLFI